MTSRTIFQICVIWFALLGTAFGQGFINLSWFVGPEHNDRSPPKSRLARRDASQCARHPRACNVVGGGTERARTHAQPVAARPGQSIRSNECPDDHGFSPDGSQGGRPIGSDAGGIRLSTQAAGGRTRAEANFCRGPVYACVSEMGAG